MVTAVPGMTCLGIALATPGLNVESDPELRTRCRSRWATLSAHWPGAAYEFWALTEADGTTARAQVTRAYADIDNPGGPGTVYLYVAGPAGAVSEEVRAAVDTDIQARRGVSWILTTYSAAEVEIDPVGTAWVSGVDTNTARSQAKDLLNEMLAAIPIGGRNVGGSRGVFRDEIEATIRQVPGVVRVALTSGDHAMTPTQVAVPAGLAWQQINFFAA